MDECDRDSFYMEDTDCGCRWQLSGGVYRNRDDKDRKVPSCKGDGQRGKCIGNREVGTLSSDKEGGGSSPSFHYGNGKSGFVDKQCHTQMDSEAGKRHGCRSRSACIRLYTGRFSDGEYDRRKLYRDEKRCL